MPRQARHHIAGCATHIVHRGVDRGACLRHARDYELYLGLLEEFSAPTTCAIHAYVLMTNHVHLLVTPADRDGLGHFMKHVAQRYAQHANRSWGRTGPLWEGRYKSCLVETGAYALACHRYIEQNPVRARMVPHAGAYRWSSFRMNAYGFPSALLVPHQAFSTLAADVPSRRRAYRELLQLEQTAAELGEIRAALRSGSAYGSEGFVAQLGPDHLARLRRARRQAAAMHNFGANRGLSPV